MDSVDDYLREAVMIDPVDISAEFIRVSSDMAYFSQRYSEVVRHQLLMRIERDRVLAQRCHDLRIELAAERGKEPSQAELERLVLRDTFYNAARTSEAKAEAEKIRIGGVVEAIRAKKDMLVSLGAHIRAEMGMTNVSMRAQTDAAGDPLGLNGEQR